VTSGQGHHLALWLSRWPGQPFQKAASRIWFKKKKIHTPKDSVILLLDMDLEKFPEDQKGQVRGICPGVMVVGRGRKETTWLSVSWCEAGHMES
jgi:hypothetical protein